MTTNKRERQKANRAARVAAADAAARTQRTRSRIITYGLIAAVTVLVIVGLNVFTGSSDDTSTTSPREFATSTTATGSTVAPTTTAPEAFIYGSGECPAEDGSSPRTIDFSEPQPLCTDPALSYTAVFDTSEGAVRVDLDSSLAPGAVNNFVTLARWGYYDNTTIFRTDPSIDIIQSGSPHTESASDPGPGYRIIDEPSFSTDSSTGQMVGPYSYSPGQLVMARSAGPNSASAQFFFTTGPNAAALDGQGTYVVLGQADAPGLGVLQQIIGLHEPDPTSGLGGAPSHTVTINSVTIEPS